MNRFLFLFILLPLPVLGQWQYENGSFGPTDLLMPVSFSYNSCSFDVAYFEDGSYQFETLVESGGCGHSHVLVIDDYQYTLPSGYSLDIYDDFYDFGNTFALASCVSQSGQSLGWQNAISAGGQLIEIDQASKIRYVEFDGVRHWLFQSLAGDVLCQGGVPYVGDLIFEGGFEL